MIYLVKFMYGSFRGILRSSAYLAILLQATGHIGQMTCDLLPIQLGNYAAAAESDQYSNRLLPMDDILDRLNDRTNVGIEKIVKSWRSQSKNDVKNKMKFARAFKLKMGFGAFVHNTELWMSWTRSIERINGNLWPNIYKGAPFLGGPVTKFVGIASTVQVNGIRIGIDKFGHSLSLGFHYFSASGGLDKKVIDEIKKGLKTEKGFLGRATTGVLSNADLVANWEGYLMYKSLFEDDVIPGKKAIVRFENGKPIIQGKFEWTDFVNDYWDETLNPNAYSKRLEKYMRVRLRDFCQDFEKDPSRFLPKNEGELDQKYSHLGLVVNKEFRIDQICKY